jgi:BASS family bile acid:Na+ symporter
MVILAVSSAVLSPLLLSVLLPWLSGSEAPQVAPLALVGTLLITQLLPLLAGLLVNHWHPQLAARLLAPFERVSKLLNLGVVGLILATQFQMLAEIRLMAFLGMLLLLAASLAIGWLMGGPGAELRKTMALTTALRNAGLGLVIVTGTFAGTPAATATLAYGIFAVLGTLLVALWWGRQRPAPQRAGA